MSHKTILTWKKGNRRPFTSVPFTDEELPKAIANGKKQGFTLLSQCRWLEVAGGQKPTEPAAATVMLVFIDKYYGQRRECGWFTEEEASSVGEHLRGIGHRLTHVVRRLDPADDSPVMARLDK